MAARRASPAAGSVARSSAAGCSSPPSRSSRSSTTARSAPTSTRSATCAQRAGEVRALQAQKRGCSGSCTRPGRRRRSPARRGCSSGSSSPASSSSSSRASTRGGARRAHPARVVAGCRSSRGRPRARRAPARPPAAGAAAGRGPLPLGPPGRHRAGAVRRARGAVPDDVLPDVPAPRRGARAGRGGGRRRAVDAPRARRAGARGEPRRGEDEQRALRRGLAAASTGRASGSGSAARAAAAASSACTRTRRSRSRGPATCSASGSWPRSSRSGRRTPAARPYDFRVVSLARARERPPAVAGGQPPARPRPRATRPAPPPAAQVDAVTVELRRRVGQTFTLAELAAAYRGADAWGADGDRGERPGRGVGARRRDRRRRGVPLLLARRDRLLAVIADTAVERRPRARRRSRAGRAARSAPASPSARRCRTTRVPAERRSACGR